MQKKLILLSGCGEKNPINSVGFLDTVLTSFAIAILSGITTSAILVFISVVVKKIINPQLEEMLYKDIKVEGNWDVIATYKNKKTATRTMEIYRKGHKVTGFLLSKSGHDEGESWEFTGEFRNTILTAIYESRDKSCMDRGTATLMVKENGMILEGICALYSSQSSAVEFAYYKCSRRRYTASQIYNTSDQ